MEPGKEQDARQKKAQQKAERVKTVDFLQEDVEKQMSAGEDPFAADNTRPGYIVQLPTDGRRAAIRPVFLSKRVYRITVETETGESETWTGVKGQIADYWSIRLYSQVTITADVQQGDAFVPCDMGTIVARPRPTFHPRHTPPITINAYDPDRRFGIGAKIHIALES